MPLAILAGLLLVGALGWIFRDRLFERVESTVERGFRGEAAHLRLYALQEMFESLGVPTTHTARLRGLPDTDHVLWLATESRNAAVERVLAWVGDGGHLVVHAAPGEDRLLDALGVSTFDADAADDDDHESRSVYASNRPDWPKLYHFLEEEDALLRADGAEDAAWFLTVRHGAGAATVIADGDFLANESVDELDHALIGWEIAALEGPPAGIEILYRDPQPSVWALLGARAGPVGISLVVLSIAGLLHAARRFGPLIPPVSRHRRRLSEHIRASGAFLWATENEDRLLAAERDALRQRIGRGRDLSDAAFANLVVRGAEGIDEQQIHDALDARTMRDPRRFTKIIRTLERLRRSS